MEANGSKSVIEHFYAPSEDMTERLRSILAAKSDLPVSFDEAAEIGIQLLSLYECLARERDYHAKDKSDGQHG